MTSPDQQGPRPTPQYVGLLTQVMSNTLDEDYQAVADRRAAADVEAAPRRRRRPAALTGMFAVLGAFGLLVGVSALQTEQDAPQLAAEREQLVVQIHDRQDRLDEMHAHLAAIQADVAHLQQTLTGSTDTTQQHVQQLRALGISAGTLPVTGPGIAITVDDAPKTEGTTGGVILDTDLQALVNGLWQAGAEAIAIDGHRLSALTAIRFAGQAITVDYRSLTPPYVVEVVGDPDTLQAKFMETDAGQTWLGLESNFGITFDTVAKDEVTLPADPRDHLLYAAPVGAR